MPLAGHHASGPWALPIPLTLVMLLVAYLYLRGCAQLRSTANSIPAWRAAGFILGLLLVWLALGSPLAFLDARFLTAHMIQHLLLMTIAPALILLGAPVLALNYGLARFFLQQILAPTLKTPPLPALGKFLANPIVCWLAATAALIIWHVPSIFAAAFSSHPLHLVEHASFLLAGFLFWWPVIQPWPSVPVWPRWPLLLYLFSATLPCDILSAYLTFCDRIVYPAYFDLSNASTNSVLRDQQFAGALMWTCITIVYLVPAVALTIRLLQRPSQEAMSKQMNQRNLRASPDSPRTT
jgi:putative membrane protein